MMCLTSTSVSVASLGRRFGRFGHFGHFGGRK